MWNGTGSRERLWVPLEEDDKTWLPRWFHRELQEPDMEAQHLLFVLLVFDLAVVWYIHAILLFFIGEWTIYIIHRKNVTFYFIRGQVQTLFWALKETSKVWALAYVKTVKTWERFKKNRLNTFCTWDFKGGVLWFKVMCLSEPDKRRVGMVHLHGRLDWV